VDWVEDFEGDLTRNLIRAPACLTTSLSRKGGDQQVELRGKGKVVPVPDYAICHEE
jgi:hypothetical protein